jgi:hypothetical protein
MKYSPLSLTRRHVLGDLYARCDALKESVPVYLDGDERELLGHADEKLGQFADAISFHLTDDMCRKLSSGHFTLTCDYDTLNRSPDTVRRVVLRSITLVGRKGYDKPVPRRR